MDGWMDGWMGGFIHISDWHVINAMMLPMIDMKTKSFFLTEQ